MELSEEVLIECICNQNDIDIIDKISFVSYNIITDGIIGVNISHQYLDTTWVQTKLYSITFDEYNKSKLELRKKKIKKLCK